MNPRSLLRLEGVTVLGLALGAYLALDGPLWLLLVLALAPDLSMLGYLAGTRTGARLYNLSHTYTAPAALGSVALLVDARLALLVALIWAGHIGADRFVGYGLKYETDFKHTHLTATPAPVQTNDATVDPTPDIAR